MGSVFLFEVRNVPRINLAHVLCSGSLKCAEDNLSLNVSKRGRKIVLFPRNEYISCAEDQAKACPLHEVFVCRG